MKKIILIIPALLLLGAGCLQSKSPAASTTTESTAVWIVNDVSRQEMRYQPIDWYGGEEAELEAAKDGCEMNCTPNGFYWRYQQGEDVHQTWVFGDASNVDVKLICGNESCTPDNPSQDEYKTVSFKEFVEAESSCRTSPTECLYFALGTGMDFFDVTFTEDGHIRSLVQHYVP